MIEWIFLLLTKQTHSLLSFSYLQIVFFWVFFINNHIIDLKQAGFFFTLL